MTKQIRRITRTAQSGHLVAYDSSQPPGHQIRIAWRDNLILATSIDNAKALQHLLTDVLALIDSEQSQPADAMTNTRKADASDELIELRARVEALEAQQRPAAVKESLTAQPGGLVERVADGICKSLHCGDTPEDWETESRAAIRAVAAWLRQRGNTLTAQLLENEVDLG